VKSWDRPRRKGGGHTGAPIRGNILWHAGNEEVGKNREKSRKHAVRKWLSHQKNTVYVFWEVAKNA
jgi:hypothetical protein